MTNITEQIRNRVKQAKNITGPYQDDRINEHIEEVMGYLADAGVPAAVLESEKVAGAAARGVIDLMETGALSAYFDRRTIQLTLATEEG